MVLSRLDYGNATLAGLPCNQLDRLQSVMNAAARLVCSARKYDHVTPLVRDLHWVRVPQQIEFKLSVLVIRCLHSTSRTSYVVCRTWTRERGRDLRQRLPVSHHLRIVRRLETARSSSLHHASETLCHPASLRLRHSAPSSVA